MISWLDLFIFIMCFVYNRKINFFNKFEVWTNEFIENKYALQSYTIKVNKLEILLFLYKTQWKNKNRYYHTTNKILEILFSDHDNEWGIGWTVWNWNNWKNENKDITEKNKFEKYYIAAGSIAYAI